MIFKNYLKKLKLKKKIIFLFLKYKRKVGKTTKWPEKKNCNSPLR